MATAAGRRVEMATAAGRRCRRWLSEIKRSMYKVADELHKLLDALSRIIRVETGMIHPRARIDIEKALRAIEGILLKDWSNKTRSEAMASLREQGRMVESSTTDTQVMLMYFEHVSDSIFNKVKRLHGILVSTYVLDSHPGLSVIFKKTQDNLTGIKLDIRVKLDEIEEARRPMDSAEGSQGELISTSAANEMEEEGVTCIEKADLEETEEANEMGEESATCIEAAEAAKGMMEEKMQTDQYSDICCRAFLSNLSNLLSTSCDEDDDTTSLSPMHFTPTTSPGDAASVVASTLQIFSVEVQEIKEEALESNWPLRVYGTVAARDTVDHNRNVIFHRARNNCQILTQKNPCLRLTGPSRAIVAIDPVDFEIQLKVKGSRKSQDRMLMHQTFNYSSGNNETTLLSNDCCKIMLRCAKLEKTVQATIVAVRVMNWRKRAWPFKSGGQVSCVAKGSSNKPEEEEEVVLQDQLIEPNTSCDGYLHLSRQAVSVELSGGLGVIIRSRNRRGYVFFQAQECKSNRGSCHLGPYEVQVTVAWSLLVRDKRCISREECVDDGQAFERTAEEMEIEEAKEMGGEDEDSDSDKTQTEEMYFDSYRQGWVSNWSKLCGSFTDKTSLSPMHFTHSRPGHSPYGSLVGNSLQINSIKVAKLEKYSGLNWPLQVYGVVAARDTADHNRNLLFSRQRNNCQILTPEEPFLRLTGPSRAIVTREPAHVEIELKVKGTTKSEDILLMSHFWYNSSISYHGLRTLYIPLEGDNCTMVLSAEQLGNSVQATIVGIHVGVPEGRPCPFDYGGRVVCSSLPWRNGELPDSQHIAADPSFRQVVLQDGAMTTCSKGYLNLARHVVSVKLRGKLEFVIEARSRSGAMAGKVVKSIDAQECNITENVCHLGDSELKITVAWSRLVQGKAWVSML